MRAAKALASLRTSAGSPKHSVVDNVIAPTKMCIGAARAFAALKHNVSCSVSVSV